MAYPAWAPDKAAEAAAVRPGWEDQPRSVSAADTASSFLQGARNQFGSAAPQGGGDEQQDWQSQLRQLQGSRGSGPPQSGGPAHMYSQPPGQVASRYQPPSPAAGAAAPHEHASANARLPAFSPHAAAAHQPQFQQQQQQQPQFQQQQQQQPSARSPAFSQASLRPEQHRVASQPPPSVAHTPSYQPPPSQPAPQPELVLESALLTEEEFQSNSAIEFGSGIELEGCTVDAHLLDDDPIPHLEPLSASVSLRITPTSIVFLHHYDRNFILEVPVTELYEITEDSEPKVVLLHTRNANGSALLRLTCASSRKRLAIYKTLCIRKNALERLKRQQQAITKDFHTNGL
ncbi:hypothetical protein DIPPA_30631 [Diplonema papillatum]|nr:hypothetical protein DIPPA_30631 [Diplonema papillatum]